MARGRPKITLPARRTAGRNVPSYRLSTLVEVPSDDGSEEARRVAADMAVGSLVHDAFGPMRVVTGLAADVDGGRVLDLGNGKQLVREDAPTIEAEWYRPNAADLATDATIVARYPQLDNDVLRHHLLEQGERTDWGGPGVIDFGALYGSGHSLEGQRVFGADFVALQAATLAARDSARPLRIARRYDVDRSVMVYGDLKVTSTPDGEVRLKAGADHAFPTNVALRMMPEYGPISQGSYFGDERQFGLPDGLYVRTWGTGTNPDGDDATYLYVVASAKPVDVVGEEVHVRLGYNQKDSVEPGRDVFAVCTHVGDPVTQEGEQRWPVWIDRPLPEVPLQNVAVTATGTNGDGTTTVTVEPMDFELKIHDPQEQSVEAGTGPVYNRTWLFFKSLPSGDLVRARLFDVAPGDLDGDPARVPGVELAAQYRTRSTPKGATQFKVYEEEALGSGATSAVSAGQTLLLGREAVVLRCLSRPSLTFDRLAVSQEDPADIVNGGLISWGARSIVGDELYGGGGNRTATFNAMPHVDIERIHIARQYTATSNPNGIDSQNVDTLRVGSLQNDAAKGTTLDCEGPMTGGEISMLDIRYAPDADFPRASVVASIEGTGPHIGEARFSGGTRGANGEVPVSCFATSEARGEEHREGIRVDRVVWENWYGGMRTDIVTERFTIDAKGGAPQGAVYRVFDHVEEHRIPVRLSGVERARVGFAGIPRRIAITVDTSDANRPYLQGMVDAAHVKCQFTRRGNIGGADLLPYLTLGEEVVLDATSGASTRLFTVWPGNRYAEDFELSFFLDPAQESGYPDGLPPMCVTFDVQYWTNQELLALEDPEHPTSPIAYSHRAYTSPLPEQVETAEWTWAGYPPSGAAVLGGSYIPDGSDVTEFNRWSMFVEVEDFVDAAGVPLGSDARPISFYELTVGFFGPGGLMEGKGTWAAFPVLAANSPGGKDGYSLQITNLSPFDMNVKNSIVRLRIREAPDA